MEVAHPTNITIIVIPLYVVLIVVERLALGRRGATHDRRDSAASLGMGLISILTSAMLIGAITWSWATMLWRHRVVDLGSGPVAWIAAMILWDLAFYWAHRWQHEVRLLWATHVVHHSSLEFNLTTALRQNVFPLSGFMFGLLALVGINPAIIVAAGGINLIYQFFIHTEVVGTLGSLELVLNTPSHHRVHHASDLAYLDKNYGGILIVWDRAFGTFVEEGASPAYGLTRNIGSYNPLRIIFDEFANIVRDCLQADRWSAKIRHVFGGPRWSPATEPERATTAVPEAPA